MVVLPVSTAASCTVYSRLSRNKEKKPGVLKPPCRPDRALCSCIGPEEVQYVEVLLKCGENYKTRFYVLCQVQPPSAVEVAARYSGWWDLPTT